MRFERRLVLLSLAAALPALVAFLALLWIAELSTQVRVALVAAVGVATVVLIQILHQRIAYPLRTLSNIVSALREEDYTLRARGGHDEDAFGELVLELNRLGETLRERRLDGIEAAALVRTIVAQLHSAIFAFGPDHRLQLVNSAGERLLASPASGLLGKTVEELGLGESFHQPLSSAVEMRFPGGSGRWSISRSTFREKGKTHHLLVISDLSRALRDEELLAWQRLVRVLSHELNNSLAPIKSIASTLLTMLNADPPPADWPADARRGLGVISSRAEALTRFTQAYARLARLPRPRLAPVDIGGIVQRVSTLGFALPVIVNPGPPAILHGDADQLEQLLINLIQNAVDASVDTGGVVTVTWSMRDNALELIVADQGQGLSGSLNLFVPFFTTKPEGTGIGLVLSRQIAEAHNGELSLEARAGGGCEAKLRLPVTPAT